MSKSYSVHADKGGVTVYRTSNKEDAIEEAERRKQLSKEEFHVLENLRGFPSKVVYKTKETQLTKNEERVLRKIKKASSIKGMAHETKDLDIEHDFHGKRIGGKDLKALSSLIQKGEVYTPRPPYVKITGRTKPSRRISR